MIIHESILSMERELHLKFLCLFNPSFVTSWVSPKKQNDGYIKTEISQHLGIERPRQTFWKSYTSVLKFLSVTVIKYTLKYEVMSNLMYKI